MTANYYTSNTMIDFSNALNDKEFIQAGDFVMYDQGDKEIFIKLDSNKNHAIRLKPKDVIRASFKKYFITGDAGSNAYLRILGSPDNSVRVEPGGGVVEQILSDKSDYNKTLSKRAFNYSTESLSTGATNYRGYQIINPVSSGVNILINIIAQCSTTHYIKRYYDKSVDSIGDITHLVTLNNSFLGGISSKTILYDCSVEVLPSTFSIYGGKINIALHKNTIIEKNLIVPPGYCAAYFLMTVNLGWMAFINIDEIPI